MQPPADLKQYLPDLWTDGNGKVHPTARQSFCQVKLWQRRHLSQRKIALRRPYLSAALTVFCRSSGVRTSEDEANSRELGVVKVSKI
jgi:hypothetical protein